MSSESIPARIPATAGDIITDAMDPMMDMVLGVRLTFAERLDPALLARASRLLLDIEPVLGCWWDERARNADWVRCATPDEAGVFTKAGTDDADADAAAFHAEPFRARGPRVAVRLLRSRDYDDVCVRFDHVAGDGWSAKQVVYLLAHAYSDLEADPDYAPTPRTGPRPGLADVWDALSDDQRARAADPPPMTSTTQWKMHAEPGARDEVGARSLTLSPERTSAVRECVHANGSTVNDALVAALVRAVDDVCPQKDGSAPAVSISADMRRIASEPALDRVANISTTQTVKIGGFARGESFADTLRHVSEAVKPYKDALWNVKATASGAPPSPVAWRAVFWLAATALRVSRAAALVTMNVGELDEARLSFGGMYPEAAFVTGPIAKYAGFPLLISSYRGAITLWTGFRGRFISGESVERYLAAIDSQLAAAVDGTPSVAAEAPAG